MIRWDTGERQMKTRLEDVAPNHTARYQWAIDELRKRCPGGLILDAACGVGYGSKMLADAGFRVIALDRSGDAEHVQREHFSHPNVVFAREDLSDIELRTDFDAAVSIETVEHIENADAWLKKLRAHCKWLVTTVPNQDVVPFDKDRHPYHFRHYTLTEFTDALTSAGWEPEGWFTQYEKWDRDRARMRPGTDGMTLGAVCR